MLRGDLAITPLPDLLERLADAKATGCVYLLPTGRHASSDEAEVVLRDGAICNLTLPGAQDAIGTRLVASRRLSPASLAEARQAQETDLAGWTMSELLIHLGLADEREVHELVNERGLSDLTELCNWSSGSWRFRRRERGGPSLSRPLNVQEALVTVAERQQEWLRLLPAIRGAGAVVSLAVDPDGHGGAAESGSAVAVEMDGDRFSLLCAVDGVRTVAELGSSAGFTLLEAGRTFAKLVKAGLVQLTLASNDDQVSPNEEEYESGSRSLDAIAAALSFDPDGSLMPAELERGIAAVGAPWQPPRTSSGDSLADALARVSAALSEAMSEPRHQDEHAAAVPPTRYETQAPSRSPHAADAARLLSQLAEEPVARSVAPAPAVSQPPPAGPADYPPRPRREDGLVDTAALLRELSSLGAEEDRADLRPVSNRVSAPSTQGGQHARKRKGMFGRG